MDRNAHRIVWLPKCYLMPNVAKFKCVINFNAITPVWDVFSRTHVFYNKSWTKMAIYPCMHKKNWYPLFADLFGKNKHPYVYFVFFSINWNLWCWNEKRARQIKHRVVSGHYFAVVTNLLHKLPFLFKVYHKILLDARTV